MTTKSSVPTCTLPACSRITTADTCAAWRLAVVDWKCTLGCSVHRSRRNRRKYRHSCWLWWPPSRRSSCCCWANTYCRGIWCGRSENCSIVRRWPPGTPKKRCAFEQPKWSRRKSGHRSHWCLKPSNHPKTKKRHHRVEFLFMLICNCCFFFQVPPNQNDPVSHIDYMPIKMGIDKLQLLISSILYIYSLVYHQPNTPPLPNHDLWLSKIL